jgi:two-component system response regulator RegA
MAETILVVDDDAILRYSLVRALTRHGHVALAAASSQEAKDLIGKQPIDRVILDLRLGEESGLALAAWMLQHQPQLKIVIITGYAAVSTAVEAIKLGVKNYLIKPVGAEEILAAFDTDVADAHSPIKTDPLSPKRLEWEHIQKVLLDHDGNISQAAKALKMHRRTLQRKLQKRPVRE